MNLRLLIKPCALSAPFPDLGGTLYFFSSRSLPGLSLMSTIRKKIKTAQQNESNFTAVFRTRPLLGGCLHYAFSQTFSNGERYYVIFGIYV